MKRSITTLALASLLGNLISVPAMADHNSPNGEGWANMPNDIHNMRIDTLDGDDDIFIDFVSQGDGADLVNRFLIPSNAPE